MSIWTPIRKVAAAAIAAVVTTAGFLTWLQGDGAADWRMWLAIAFTAAVPVVLAYLVPSDGLVHPWWPIRKIGALALSALASSTVFLAWLGGTGVLSARDAVAILAAAIVPALLGYITPSSGTPPGGAPAIDAKIPIAAAVLALVAAGAFLVPSKAEAHWVARQIWADGNTWAIHYDINSQTASIEVFQSLGTPVPYYFDRYRPSTGQIICPPDPWNFSLRAIPPGLGVHHFWRCVISPHLPGDRIRVTPFRGYTSAPVGFYARGLDAYGNPLND